MKSFNKIVGGLTKMVDELKEHNRQQKAMIAVNSNKMRVLTKDSALRSEEVGKAELAITNISALTTK